MQSYKVPQISSVLLLAIVHTFKWSAFIGVTEEEFLCYFEYLAILDGFVFQKLINQFISRDALLLSEKLFLADETLKLSETN